MTSSCRLKIWCRTRDCLYRTVTQCRYSALLLRWCLCLLHHWCTIRCRYNTVSFLPNPRNWHFITRPQRLDMGVFREYKHRSMFCFNQCRVCAISCHIGPRYNSTRLYYKYACRCKCGLHQSNPTENQHWASVMYTPQPAPHRIPPPTHIPHPHPPPP